MIADIRNALSKIAEEKLQAIVYTDGSTSTKGKVTNSGSGIFVTDRAHRPVCSTGFVVRSDGNNFLAEIAAAAVVVKACPPGLPLTLRIDSIGRHWCDFEGSCFRTEEGSSSGSCLADRAKRGLSRASAKAPRRSPKSRSATS